MCWVLVGYHRNRWVLDGLPQKQMGARFVTTEAGYWVGYHRNRWVLGGVPQKQLNARWVTTKKQMAARWITTETACC